MDEKQEYVKWLSDLNAGDAVAVPNGGWGSDAVTICKITHATKTQIHIGRMKYRRQDGRVVGRRDWTSHRLQEPTSDVRKRARHHQLTNWLAEINRTHQNKQRLLSLDQLEALHAALAAEPAPKEAP